VGRAAEATLEFLLAAERFDAEHARGDGLTGDEDDWARWSRFRAAKQLLSSGERIAAHAMLQTELDEEDRAELERLLAL
jgi:hypothetical protein